MRFKSYHDPQDEPLAEPLDPYAFDFDYGDTLSKEELKGETIFSRHLGSRERFWPVLIYEEVTRPTLV